MRPLFLAVIALTLPGALASAQPSTVILVRHAEKASQTESDPALSAAGLQRARDLLAAVVDAEVTSVITTQYVRTQQTGAPVAAAMKLTPIVVANSGNTAANVADVAASVRARPAGDVVLVVGHSNTIPEIIAALGGPRMPDICDSRYSMLFILEMNGSKPPRLIRANYGTADPVDPKCTKM